MSASPPGGWDLAQFMEEARSRERLQALLVRREPLVQILKRACAELHAERRRTTATRKQELLEAIAYWEAVLVWIKCQDSEDVVIMRRGGRGPKGPTPQNASGGGTR